MKVDDIINEKTSSLELSKTDKENEKRKPGYCERKVVIKEDFMDFLSERSTGQAPWSVHM